MFTTIAVFNLSENIFQVVVMDDEPFDIEK